MRRLAATDSACERASVPGALRQGSRKDEDEDDSESEDIFEDAEEAEARTREEAGADWMVEQGFDRKD